MYLYQVFFLYMIYYFDAPVSGFLSVYDLFFFYNLVFDFKL